MIFHLAILLTLVHLVNTTDEDDKNTNRSNTMDMECKNAVLYKNRYGGEKKWKFHHSECGDLGELECGCTESSLEGVQDCAAPNSDEVIDYLLDDHLGIGVKLDSTSSYKNCTLYTSFDCENSSKNYCEFGMKVMRELDALRIIANYCVSVTVVRERFRSYRLSEGCSLVRTIRSSLCEIPQFRRGQTSSREEVLLCRCPSDNLNKNAKTRWQSLQFMALNKLWGENQQTQVWQTTPQNLSKDSTMNRGNDQDAAMSSLYEYILSITAGAILLVIIGGVLICRRRRSHNSTGPIVPAGKIGKNISLDDIQSIHTHYSKDETCMDQNEEDLPKPIVYPAKVEKNLVSSVNSVWKSKQPLVLLSEISIGHGDFGDVWKVEQTTWGTPMALKRINIGKALRYFGELESILQEGKYMLEIEDSNVVKVFNSWVEGPDGLVNRMSNIYLSDSDRSSAMSFAANQSYFLFLQMELCDYSLETWLTLRLECEYDYVPDIMLQIMRGLSAIHEKNIVHRDLTPSNIFNKIDSEGASTWKIGDLGVSIKNGGGPEDSSVTPRFGSIKYSSPEMNNGGRYDGKTDIFSLGLVYLEIICPDLAKGKVNKFKVFDAIRFQDVKQPFHPAYLNLLNVKMRRIYDIVVSRMLYTDANVRPDANQMVKELEYLRMNSCEEQD